LLQLAWIGLSFALLFTILFFPLVNAVEHSSGPDAAGAGIGIFFLAIFRLGAMIGGLSFAVGTGRMTGLGNSRAGQIVLLVVAAILAEIVSCGLHFFSIDFRGGQGWGMAGAVFASVLPGLLLAGGFLGLMGTGKWSAALCLSSLAGSVVVGLAAMVISESYDRQWNAERAKQQEIDSQVNARAEAQRITLAKLEIREMQESAGVEDLLAFTDSANPAEVRTLAIEKILSWKGHAGMLTAALNCDHRFEALSILAANAATLSPNEREKCWHTVGLVAEDFAKRLPNHENTLPVDDLFAPTADLMKVPGEPTKDHEKYVLAVQEVIRLADLNAMVFRVSPQLRDYKPQSAAD
jgi:hypothetical protein